MEQNDIVYTTVILLTRSIHSTFVSLQVAYLNVLKHKSFDGATFPIYEGYIS